MEQSSRSVFDFAFSSKFCVYIGGSSTDIKKYIAICAKYGIEHQNMWTGEANWYGLENGVIKCGDTSWGDFTFSSYDDFADYLEKPKSDYQMTKEQNPHRIDITHNQASDLREIMGYMFQMYGSYYALRVDDDSFIGTYEQLTSFLNDSLVKIAEEDDNASRRRHRIDTLKIILSKLNNNLKTKKDEDIHSVQSGEQSQSRGGTVTIYGGNKPSAITSRYIGYETRFIRSKPTVIRGDIRF